MRTGLAFVGTPEPLDYGRLFSRLRWRRAVAAETEADLDPSASADGAFAAAEIWAVVLLSAAVPWGKLALSSLPSGAPALAGRLAPASGASAVHTLRELESGAHDLPASAGPPPLLAFRIADFLPRPGETVTAFLGRVAAAHPAALPGGLAALVAGDPSERERPELIERLPPGGRRLADVGCGSGATGAALKRRDPLLDVTGIEIDAAAASRAAARLDRVVCGDAASALSALALEGHRFDSFLLGDVLEHTADPVALLTAARSAAEPGARLVASVPNAGHLSVVRDLTLGRFDPAPAGLLDAGHLRWFTRPFLAEALEEGGWSVYSIDGIGSEPPPGEQEFLDSLAGWPGLDPALLSVYQWIAVATA
ncbi:MAG: class I SAM-dependent methyltransferase [Acidobacteria bacterium]|nr:class I SAM-dependent methyltransferase [Acidobacteriota bacterium]MCA1611360.1 class I SAM-dependent methyltransferase [Acidobacteriota bacterium]